MLSQRELISLLERASELNAKREFHAVAQLLDGLPKSELLREPEIFYLQALALYRIGHEGAALDAIRELAASGNLLRNERLYRRNRNLEGVLLVEKGELREAEILFLDLAVDAAAAGDARMVANITNNLAVIATVTGRLNAALAAYTRALAAFTQVGNETMLAMSHHNIAMTYRKLGHLAKADKHFAIAQNFARAFGTEEELTLVTAERALLIHQLGDVALAEYTARRTLKRALSLENVVLEGEVRRVLGIMLAHAEQWGEARFQLERSLEIALSTSKRLLQAEAREELAWIEYRTGNPELSREHAEISESLYRAMGAVTYAIRVAQRVSGTDPSRMVG